MPGDPSIGIDDGRHAHALAAHLDDRVGERRLRRHDRQIASGAHHVGHSREQPAAQRAPGMRPREILRREAAGIEERERERVPERLRGGRARRGREAERAGLALHARIEMDGRGLGQRALLVAGDGDHGRTGALDVRHEAHELIRLAGVREHHHDVVLRDHAEVAVHRFRGVHEERGRAGRGERGGQLAADVPGLADAAHDHPAAAVEDELDRAHEAVAQPGGDLGDGLRLDGQDLAGRASVASRSTRAAFEALGLPDASRKACALPTSSSTEARCSSPKVYPLPCAARPPRCARRIEVLSPATRRVI
jgi:hypothetical protein